MLFSKIAKNQKNPFYSEDHEEIKIVPYIFIPFNCPLPASKGFLRVYCFEFNLEPFDLCEKSMLKSKHPSTWLGLGTFSTMGQVPPRTFSTPDLFHPELLPLWDIFHPGTFFTLGPGVAKG